MIPRSDRAAVVLVASAVAMGVGCRQAKKAVTPPAATATDEAPPRVEPFEFGWPRPSRAHVVERSLEKGKHAVTEYWLVIADEPDGRVSIRYADFRFLEIEGLDLEDPAVARQIEALEFQTALVMPPLYVDADGTWSAVGDLTETMNMVARMYPDREIPKKMAQSDETRRLVGDAMSKIWDGWAGAWVGLELPPGYLSEYDTEVGEAMMHGTYENLGLDPKAPANYRLRWHVAADDANTRILLGAILDSLMTAAGKKGSPGYEAFMQKAGFAYEHEVHASVHAVTLQPRHVFARTTITVVWEGKADARVEEHEYFFDWETDQSSTPR